MIWVWAGAAAVLGVAAAFMWPGRRPTMDLRLLAGWQARFLAAVVLAVCVVGAGALCAREALLSAERRRLSDPEVQIKAIADAMGRVDKAMGKVKAK
jgi:hypothetical protein